MGGSCGGLGIALPASEAREGGGVLVGIVVVDVGEWVSHDGVLR